MIETRSGRNKPIIVDLFTSTNQFLLRLIIIKLKKGVRNNIPLKIYLFRHDSFVCYSCISPLFPTISIAINNSKIKYNKYI